MVYAPDLMDRSRVSTTGARVEFVADPVQLVTEALEPSDLVLVDLARSGVLDLLSSIAARTVGFAAHVDEALVEAARVAGCDEVLARSVFFRRLPKLLQSATRS